MKVRFSFLDLTLNTSFSFSIHQLQCFQPCEVIPVHKQKAPLVLWERTRQWQRVHFCVAGISITYGWGTCSGPGKQIGLKYLCIRAMLRKEETVAPVRSWARFLQHCDARRAGKGGRAQSWTPLAREDISYIQWVTRLIWRELLKGRAGKMGVLGGRWKLWGSQTR